MVDKRSGQIEIKKYYQHMHKEMRGISTMEWLSRLDVVINNMFDRFIERLSGRQVVLFLSGGYDSRLIIYNLYKRGYKNVVCVSLKSENDKDVQVAKKIAEKFSYRLVVFDYSKEYWRYVEKELGFWNRFHSCSQGYVIYYPQGYVVLQLLKDGLIDDDSVVVTGNSWDVVEGNDVSTFFSKGRKYSSDDIVKEIKKAHGLNIINDIKQVDIINKEILKSIPTKTEYSSADAQDAFEYFNWYERQCKYVTSDVRNYDELSGNEWALPLWDDEFVQFWLDLPIEMRFKRKLYYEYVHADNLPTANTDTMFLKCRRFIEKHCNWIIDLLYPLRQIQGFYSKSILFSYHGILNVSEWMYILWATRGNKVKHISALTYKYFKEKYNMDIFDFIKSNGV